MLFKLTNKLPTAIELVEKLEPIRKKEEQPKEEDVNTLTKDIKRMMFHKRKLSMKLPEEMFKSDLKTFSQPKHRHVSNDRIIQEQPDTSEISDDSPKSDHQESHF